MLTAELHVVGKRREKARVLIPLAGGFWGNRGNAKVTGRDYVGGQECGGGERKGVCVITAKWVDNTMSGCCLGGKKEVSVVCIVIEAVVTMFVLDDIMYC